jgi:hypothetical protein
VESADEAKGEAKVDAEAEELVQQDQPDVVPSDKAGDGAVAVNDTSDNLHVVIELEAEPVVLDKVVASPRGEQIGMTIESEKEVMAEKKEEPPVVAEIQIEASEPVQKVVTEQELAKNEAQIVPEEPPKSIVSEATNELAAKEKAATEV